MKRRKKFVAMKKEDVETMLKSIKKTRSDVRICFLIGIINSILVFSLIAFHIVK